MKTIETIKKDLPITPCQGGGASFKTHNLIKTSSGYKYKPSLGSVSFALVFLLIGLVIICIGVYNAIKTMDLSNHIYFILFGTLFFSVGLFIFYTAYKPIVFDKTSNYFYKGYKKNKKRGAENFIPLSNIIALQLIGETISNKNGGYKSFEINLVLNDATRINVVDHGNLKKIIDDAEILSKYLNIPIWHAESSKTETK
jgi:hypothetical protein